ncbi:uncharacterized protein CLUP02_03921 [Colletotrichum lupini]|uniref:Uncharacterized protein n=1 Tax=Colletotrichum lupini TaxID=145971 RepID=A0A9Q8WCM0_9PEZI|nr:uncharacterized protein CLUP02_03921 [Colletotrichum lupini]UQC78444.1 hypothetical protein CLUP02_03921 [Colletotrichum lupini]
MNAFLRQGMCTRNATQPAGESSIDRLFTMYPFVYIKHHDVGYQTIGIHLMRSGPSLTNFATGLCHRQPGQNLPPSSPSITVQLIPSAASFLAHGICIECRSRRYLYTFQKPPNPVRL